MNVWINMWMVVFSYTDYLAGVYKSKNKAAFERQKNEDDFKRKFDPFMFKEEVEQRSRMAQTTAVKARHMPPCTHIFIPLMTMSGCTPPGAPLVSRLCLHDRLCLICTSK